MTTTNEYDITRRGYDGKIMVWASTDSGQQCIGVFENEFDASRFLDEFNARRNESRHAKMNSDTPK